MAGWTQIAAIEADDEQLHDFPAMAVTALPMRDGQAELASILDTQRDGSPASISLITGSTHSNFIGQDHQLPTSQTDILQKNQTFKITNIFVTAGDC